MQTAKISQVVADPNQPRKYFAADKMAVLKDSIEKYGIEQPLVVQELDGKYLLVEGERRFRCATELGLKEVPVIVRTFSSEADKLVQQFHIQETHLGWTPIEKADAIKRLTEELNMDYAEVSKLLGIRNKTALYYSALYKLANRAAFEKSEINLEWATTIHGVASLAKKMYQANDLELSLTQQALLEKKIIGRIKSGEIKTGFDATKLKDAFRKDFKSIKTFLEDDEITVEGLFSKTKARDAYHLRNLINHCSYMSASAKYFLSNRNIVPTHIEIGIIRGCKRMLDKVMNECEKLEEQLGE